jgi:hypothetical protein
VARPAARQMSFADLELRGRAPESTGLTLERAAILKVLCDGYLIKRFEKMVEQGPASGSR